MVKLDTVPEKIDFAAEEAKTLEHWRQNGTFKKSVELNRDLPSFTFYDGPPFATGLPHYGHLLMSTIKDIIPRWVHQKGHNVERRFGWDTHGLPVEFEIDKMLGINGPADVHAMGIDKYNAECRKIVMRYAGEWRQTVERIGRWIDFDNDYKTLYPTYMESVWWVFSELYKKGLVYRGVKVMPYSTGCATPLSNFEAGQNYKDVRDTAAFVGFQLEDQPNRYLVAWTTTPWTLPSNLALCVHPDLDYIVIQEKVSDKEYVVMEQRVIALFKSADAYTVVERFKGAELKGLAYQPLFSYFAHLKLTTKAFHVLAATFVTTEQGTGIVHQAPYFGEIDYQTCLENGVIAKDSKIVCPVDERGHFTDEVPDFSGQYVKDADDAILKRLKASGHLLKKEQINHSYPYCWRSDTPLLYKAVPSWFIRVESLVDRLLAANETTYWVPGFVREKRFGNWLRDARDWAVSRNRFWGTPINLWTNDDFSEIRCPSSIAELEAWTGQKITDLHRESVDSLTISSSNDSGVLRRVPEVFDCWFESGSMPYAQNHYPFENKDNFGAKFPADFVAEGIDQTRGWFYTLMVLGTALFDRAPFKNLICSGLILAADGNKMSKSKKNFPDPMEVIDRYGADALRLYLINSPVVKGENLRFREDGVREVLKDVFLPWFNAYRFFVQNVQIYEHETKSDFSFRSRGFTNVMDRWILSFTNSLIKFVHAEMDAYRLYTVVGPLTKYFETLTNCYIRFNRERIRGKAAASVDVGGGEEDDRILALSTLGHVLVLITRMMAPFTPFFCEYLWRNLKATVGHTEDSVHFTRLPQLKEEFIDATVERRVAAMRTVVEIVRVLRERKNISVKYPLKEMVVINRDAQFLEDLKSLEPYILGEVNVEQMTVSQNKDKYGVRLRAEPNFRMLGARLKTEQKKVAEYLKNSVTDEELEEFLKIGTLIIHGHELTQEEVGVSFTYDPAARTTEETWETEANNACVVMLNTTENQESMERGLAREVMNRIQRLRKSAKLLQTEEATVYVAITPADSSLAKAMKAHQTSIEESTKTPLKYGVVPEGIVVKVENSSKIKDADLELRLVTSAVANLF